MSSRLVRTLRRRSIRTLLAQGSVSIGELIYDALPSHLPRHLLFAVLAFRIQADRLGDLDHETRKILDRTNANKSGLAMADRLKSLDRKRTELTPGTVLVREWDQQSHRVMVLADGFAWNGQTYDSLTKVAFAITGTRWNGPRFFGLRDKQAPPTSEAGR